MSEWKVTDWTTGEDKSLPEQDRNSPTVWWIEGWNDGMDGISVHHNPYRDGTTEAHEWDDGWNAAEAD
jgi:ribosome modulation factor